LLVTIHGFRDNEVLLQTGYDVIVISPLLLFMTDSERATMTFYELLMFSESENIEKHLLKGHFLESIRVFQYSVR